MRQTEEERKLIKQVVAQELSSLGRITWQEMITLIHFVALAVLWLSRNPGKAGGWGKLFLSGLVSPQ